MKYENRFCAFCRHPRKVYLKMHLSLTNYLLCFLSSIVFSYAAWHELDPRFLLIFLFFIAIAELFVIVRWRMSVKCKICGFDPVMYKNSPKQASKVVQEFIEHREGKSIFSKNPKEHLPSIILDPVKEPEVRPKTENLPPE